MQVSEETVYSVLNAEDFSGDSVARTVKYISANPERFYLLSPDTGLELHEAIEELSGNFDDSAELTCVRFAREINFPLRVYLQIGDNIDGGLEVHTFSELLGFLKYDEAMRISRNDFHVIVDDIDIDDDEIAGRVVADIFQQMIYLNLNIDVKKKSEIRKSLIKDRFRAKYQELRREVEDKKSWLESVSAGGELSDKGQERVQKIIDALGKMLAAFDDGRKRPIRIAAMGTKKAGKSVIINGILKRDYAPTSSELPTPNIIKYIPENADSPLTLEYNGESIIFDSGDELNKYILGEFKEAQKHTGEGAGLDDMIIHYPSEDFSGYEIWDTPGPNFAGAGREHHEIAESCIRSADVCIFVENYSNHLTDDEVKFLQQIHSTFRSNNKFYSLFVAVNRIDERYSADVEKSVSRLVDYIRSRLDALGYKNIILFGTSALQSFYLGKVMELVGRIEPGEDLIDRVNSLKKSNKKYMTQLRFVESSLENLRDFHNIDSPTASDLRIFSGMPQLERYLKYIGEQKVDAEIVDNAISRCESQFDVVRNASLISRMLEISEEDRKYLVELGRLLDGLNRDVDRVIDGVRSLVSQESIASALREIEKSAKSSRREVSGIIEGICRDVVNNSRLDEDDIEQMRLGRYSSNMKAIIKNITEAVAGLNRRSAETVAAMTQAESGKYSRRVEAGIQKAREEISRKTEEVREKVRNTTAHEIMQEFSIPDFPPSLNKMSFTAKIFGAGVDDEFLRREADRVHRTETHTEIKTETVTKYRTRTRERKSRGFWEGLCSFFGKKYYEDYQEKYQEEIQKPYTVSKEVYDVDGFRRSILYELERRVRRVVESAHDEIESEAERITEEIYADISRQCEEINAEYSGLFESFRNDISMASDETSRHKKSLETDIELLRRIDDNFAPFFTMWDEILSGRAKERG